MKKILIGCREWAGLPDLGIPAMKAKIDTGARTTALHAAEIQPFRRHGQTWIRFFVRASKKDNNITRCEKPISDRRTVTNSGGSRELRYCIKTTLSMGESSHMIELTLTDRSDMKFELLIGRTAMRSRFLIDPGRTYRLGKPLKVSA